MKLKHEYLYCVAQKSGHLCLWSMATNRSDSWRNFGRTLKEIPTPVYRNKTIQDIKQDALQSGHVCVRMRVMLAEEGKGK
jgi:hypothetical protein